MWYHVIAQWWKSNQLRCELDYSADWQSQPGCSKCKEKTVTSTFYIKRTNIDILQTGNSRKAKFALVTDCTCQI